MPKKETIDGAAAKKMSDAEIVAALAELRNEVFDLRSQTVTEKVEDTSRFRKARKEIARLLSEQSARRHGQSAPSEPRKPRARKKAGAKPKAPAKRSGAPRVKKAGAGKKKASGAKAAKGE